MGITVDMIMSASPCAEYSRSRVEDLWAGREALTAREIAGLEIPADDRLWALISCCLDDRQRRLFACDCAEIALGLVTHPDPRSIESIRVARLYAVGEATAEQLSAAWAAAWAADRGAARASAWASAWDARAAARDAARSAARAADWASAWAYAWDARAAAMAAQLQIALEYAEGTR